jgi:thiamine biosynthesis lipoprotein
MRCLQLLSLCGLLCAQVTWADALHTRTQVMMGTYVSLSLPSSHTFLAKGAFSRLKAVEMALSSYDPQAQIYQLNHQHHISPLEDDTYEALQLSTHYYEQTQGYFDITIGSITKGLFHFGEDERVPTEADVNKARLDFKGLTFTRNEARTQEGVILDLGGMGKGFGVDKAREYLHHHGLNIGVIALSGDIFCFHRCEMAIQEPFGEGLLARFEMAQGHTAISTSGTYRRYVNTPKHHHLINPKSREAQKNFISITLISDVLSNADLDAYATAASVMPRAEAFTFLRGFNTLGFLIVDTKQRVYKNAIFDALVKDFHFEGPAYRLKREYIRVVPLTFQNSKKRAL